MSYSAVDGCLRLRHLRSVVLLPLIEVRYFLARDKYVEAHTDGKKYLLNSNVSISMLRTTIPGEWTLIHRNCLVRTELIFEISVDPKSENLHLVRLRGSNEQLNISKSCYTKLRRELGLKRISRTSKNRYYGTPSHSNSDSDSSRLVQKTS